MEGPPTGPALISAFPGSTHVEILHWDSQIQAVHINMQELRAVLHTEMSLYIYNVHTCHCTYINVTPVLAVFGILIFLLHIIILLIIQLNSQKP